MRRRVAVLVLVLLAAIGCAPNAAETTFTVTLEAGDQVAPLPVTLVE